MMTRVLSVSALVLAISSSAAAQTTGSGYADALTPSLAAVAKAMHATIRRDLAEAVQAMPAEEFSFRPTPEVRTFAQLIGHVINANHFFCSQARQDTSPNTVNHEQLAEKSALVQALNGSLSYCDAVYAGTTDANFTEPIHMGPGVGMGAADTVRGAILTFNTAHDNEHYGNVVLYLRLKGHVPPSTAREQQSRK